MNKSKSAPDSILFVFLLALIFWMPIPFGSNRPWAVAILEIWIFAMGIAWLVLYLQEKIFISQVLVKARYVLLLFVLYILFIIFQLIPWSSTGAISVDTRVTLSGLLLSCAYLLLLFLTLNLVNSRRRIMLFAGTIILTGVFQALYGSFMELSVLGGVFVRSSGIATGSFINRDHFAGYLEITLAMGIGMMIAMLDEAVIVQWKGRLRSWLRLLLSPKARLRLYLVMMVIALILTRSRMGNTAFFTSLLIAGGIGLVLSKRAVQGTVILLVSLVVIDIFLVGTWRILEYEYSRKFALKRPIDSLKNSSA